MRIKYISIFIIGLILFSCKRSPKIIATTAIDEPSGQSTGIFSDMGSVPTTESLNTNPNELHNVLVKEVLPTEKYVYLNVTENGENFWIATRKQDVEVGKNYIYKGGLLKTNFESKEHNRTFEKVFLVGNIIPSEHGHDHNDLNPNTGPSPNIESSQKDTEIIAKEGSIKISELVQNSEKYAGKSVQITGECVKINPNIMGRHWIHLKDGSKDDYDLVVTSDLMVPEGHVVTLLGTVALNKDFGAGYKYDLIIENGKLIN